MKELKGDVWHNGSTLYPDPRRSYAQIKSVVNTLPFGIGQNKIVPSDYPPQSTGTVEVAVNLRQRTREAIARSWR